MTVRFASQAEIDGWDNLVISNPDGGNIMQSTELAEIKHRNKWRIRFVVANECAMTIHERSIFCLGKLWYIPKGPGVSDTTQLKTLVPALRSFALLNRVFIIKIEPEIINNDDNMSDLKSTKIISSRSIQPNVSTVIVDLRNSLDEIMANLPQKSRHAIKRAQRDGIKVKMVDPNDKNFAIMLGLMGQTMSDKQVMMRSDDYYTTFWKTYIHSGVGAMFFAYDRETPVAGAFVSVFGDKGTYKDGGSIKEKTIYGASHALQWHIIQWLHDKGIGSYDLCGTPPKSEAGNPDHPYYGIGLFKTSFNKEITEFIGTFDIAVRPFSYKIWSKFGERIVYRFYTLFLKTMFY